MRATALFDELIEDEQHDTDADDADNAIARLDAFADAERWSDAGLSGDDSDYEDFRAEERDAMSVL